MKKKTDSLIYTLAIVVDIVAGVAVVVVDEVEAVPGIVAVVGDLVFGHHRNRVVNPSCQGGRRKDAYKVSADWLLDGRQ